MSLEVTKTDTRRPMWLVMNADVSVVMAENLSVNIAALTGKGLCNDMCYILLLQDVSQSTCFNCIEKNNTEFYLSGLLGHSFYHI